MSCVYCVLQLCPMHVSSPHKWTGVCCSPRFILDHPRSGMVYNFGGIRMYVSVCIYVYNTITFESLDVGSHFRSSGISWGDTGQVYMKVIRSRSRSQEQKGLKSLFPHCKTLIGRNSGSVKHRAVKFACNMAVRLWQIEWCDHHLCYVTERDHA